MAQRKYLSRIMLLRPFRMNTKVFLFSPSSFWSLTSIAVSPLKMMSAVGIGLFESIQNDFLICWMPSFSSSMFVTFKLSLIPEFIGCLRELFMLHTCIVYGIAFSLKKFSNTRKRCSCNDLYRRNCVSTDSCVPKFVVVMSFIFSIFYNIYTFISCLLELIQKRNRKTTFWKQIIKEKLN
jgi:hypothetical protein